MQGTDVTRHDPSPEVGRRRLLKWVAGGALAATGAGLGAIRLASDSDRPKLPGMQLSATNFGVDSLEVPLDAEHLTRLGGGRWQTQQLPTSTHSMVALTWARSSRPPAIRIRSRRDGSWQPWRPLPVLEDMPDLGSAERTDVTGTDLVWVGAADGVQVDVQGSRPDGLTLVLLHPVRLRGRTAFKEGTGTTDTTRTRAPRPELLRRGDWGANKKWRNGGPYYNDTIKQVHVHHTANSNDYSRDDVPGLIRGMYRYHTHNLGWSDIGYNFLVDRFGRTWIGRAGGARRPVRGAHTLGFNGTSTGVSVIGNFETATPNRKIIRAIAAVAAWKLDHYDRNPTGHTRVTSEGSDKYAAGKRVRLPVIDGHRDTNDTACPGQHLYDALPRIRRRTKAIMDSYPAS